MKFEDSKQLRQPKLENELAEKKNEVPFERELVDSDVLKDIARDRKLKLEDHMGNGKFNELENNPDEVIRIDQYRFRADNKIDLFKLEQITAIHKKLYRELETEYGIRVPADFLIGEKKERRCRALRYC